MRLRRSELLGIPVYPVLLAASFVVTRFLQSLEPIQVLGRATLVFVLVALAIQIAFRLITRRMAVGGYFAAVTMMLIADPIVGLLLVVAGTIPLVRGLRHGRRIDRTDWLKLTAVLNFVAILVLTVNVSLIGQRLNGIVLVADPTVAIAPAGAPNVYLLMLDGYPRADTLAADYAFDNEPFLGSMADLGFDVAPDAHSNYNSTLLTLTSMLNMRPVHEVIAGAPKPPDDARALIHAINESTGLATLRGLGYEVVSIAPGLSAFSLYAADRLIDTGQVNGFEVTIARVGLTPLILPGLQRTWFHDQQRDRLTTSLERLAELAAEPALRPRFVFAHLLSPHPPIVFAADGSPVEGNTCFPQGCDLWAEEFARDDRELLLGQLAHLNDLVRATVARIVGADPNAIVIVFSDHGHRHDLDDPTEMLHSLFLSRTPGHAGLFPSDTSPINILPRVLDAYDGLDLPLAPEASYVLDLRRILTTGYLDFKPLAP